MNRKINIDRPEIGSEQIEDGKNFNSLLKQFRMTNKPFFKNPFFLSGVAIVVAAAVTGIILLGQKKSNSHFETSSIALVSCVNPPLKETKISFTDFNLNAEQGGTLEFKTGSKIIIPANAFADDNGNLIKGGVALKYREFHDAVDFFVSGIPMTYDSGGTKYQFESAGMIEMQGFKDGKKINIIEGKSIGIELASVSNGTEYNLYELDTLHNNWSCLGKDKVVTKKMDSNLTKVKSSAETKSENQFDIKKIENKIAEVEKKKEKEILNLPAPTPKPLFPKKINKEKYTFDIEVDAKEFPELAIYKGVQFEIGDENKNFNTSLYSITWEDAALKEGTKKGENYLLSLKKGSKKYEFIVYPVFDGNFYESATIEYKNKYKMYTQTLENRRVEEARMESEYKSKIVELKKLQADLVKKQKLEEEQRILVYQGKLKSLQKQREEEIDRIKEQQRAEFYAMNTEDRVTRFFAINRFGTFNSDCPRLYPTGQAAIASFVNENLTPLKTKVFYHVDKLRNGIFPYYKNPDVNFSFTPESTNYLWAVENGVLYYIDANNFRKLELDKGKLVIVMKKIERKFQDAEEMRDYFNI